MRLLLFAVLLALAAPVSASAEEETAAESRTCFPSWMWDGWSVSEAGDAIYLRVRNNEIYRVELTPGSRVRKSPGRFLVNISRGTGYVCSALDLDLTLADDLGYRRPLFPQSLRRLTAEEIAALSPGERPS